MRSHGPRTPMLVLMEAICIADELPRLRLDTNVDLSWRRDGGTCV